MGDRFDRRRRGGMDAWLLRTRGKPPPTILGWGLERAASIGHNNGPPLDDEAPGYLWRRYRWSKAHAAAWKTPSVQIVRFRLGRAEAAGLSYRDYVATLLDSGRYAQAKDFDMARATALKQVRATWSDVLARLCPTAQRMDAAIVLASLTAAYDDDARAYHGLAHIAAVLADLALYAPDSSDQDTLRMAALFHDVVYDTRRSDNEVASAALARLHLTALGAAPERVATIARMIEATRHRQSDVDAADADTALLLDCDLAILGASTDRYLAYATAIRREYAHVPEADFRAGRARVLRTFFERPQLYVTPALATRWEAAARANLAAEIERLTS